MLSRCTVNGHRTHCRTPHWHQSARGRQWRVRAAPGVPLRCSGPCESVIPAVGAQARSARSSVSARVERLGCDAHHPPVVPRPPPARHPCAPRTHARGTPCARRSPRFQTLRLSRARPSLRALALAQSMPWRTVPNRRHLKKAANWRRRETMVQLCGTDGK